jgi:hypothetical protein
MYIMPSVSKKTSSKVVKTAQKGGKAPKKVTKPMKQETKKQETAKQAAKPAAKQVAKQAAKPAAKQVNQKGGDKPNPRSFKVQLPGKEDFVGRFTGLTPYQAANKALSKYYREATKTNNKKALKANVTFTIRESTRGSKRGTYTYNGARVKLDEPVKYTIKNGDEEREIIKNFKNKLTKVKKNDQQQLAKKE